MNSHSDLNAFLDHIEAHPEELLVWTENQVVLAELVKRAQQEGALVPPKKPLWKQVAQFCHRFNLPDLNSLHGNAYVDDTLLKDLRGLAVIIAVSNVVTIAPALSLLVISFGGPPIVSASGGLGIGWVLLKGMNAMSEQIITKWPRETHNRWVNIVGLALLQSTISSVAGIGMILANEAVSLAQQWANTQAQAVITAQYEAGQEQVELLQIQQQDYQRRCDALKAKLDEHAEGSTARNDVHIDALGSFADLFMDRSEIPTEQLIGKCHIAEGYRRDVLQLQQQLVQERAAAEDLIRTMGALDFLRQVAPNAYALHFNESGLLLSGTLKADLATQLFFEKLRQGKVGALLLALFVLTVSVILSAVMVLQLESFRRRADVVRSFDPQIALLRDELFYRAQLGLLKALAALPETDSAALDSQPLE